MTRITLALLLLALSACTNAPKPKPAKCMHPKFGWQDCREESE